LTRDQLVLDMQSLCRERNMSVLFVTHSIAEAVFLSDRVVVMTPRPGKIDEVIDIDLPRPRTLAMRETPAFAHYSRPDPRRLPGARRPAGTLSVAMTTLFEKRRWQRRSRGTRGRHPQEARSACGCVSALPRSSLRLPRSWP